MTTRKWGTEFLVNTTTANAQQNSRVAALPDGGFVITWADFTINGTLIRWQRFDATGAKVGPEQTSATPFGNQIPGSVTVLADGNLWIANTDFDSATNDNVVGNVYSPDGVFLRAQNPNTSGLDHKNVDIAPLLAGSIAVYENILRDVGGAALHTDIIMKGFDATGVVNIAEQIVHGNVGLNQTNPHVAVNPGSTRFVVTWQQNQDIFARVFTSAGAPVVAEFAVNTTSGAASGTEVAWLNDEEFVTVWINQDNVIANGGDGSSSAIKFMICASNGSPIGTERLVNTTTLQSQIIPAVTVLPGGGFAVAWQDSSTLSADNSDFAIRLQAFNGLGEKLGGEILVNTTTAGAQQLVQLATLEDGRVIVTWSDASATGGDTSGTAVRAQIVDPRDGIVDGTSGIDKLYGHDNVGDIMTGFAGADTMFGLAGADTLEGGDGADTLNGGRGDDTLYGGNDIDNLIGELGDDEQYGDAGNDNLFGSLGADLLRGGAGFDKVVYSGSTSAINLNFASGIHTGGFAEADTLVEIDNVLGSIYGDTIVGGATAMTINSFSGADNVKGSAGNDTIFGGTEADILNGGLGADEINGGTASDSFVFAIGASGQTATTLDKVTDYTKGIVGTGDEFDFTNNLTVGGVVAAATANQASINASTGVATFFAGSGTTLADALADIATSLTTGGNAVGEFAFFKVNNAGNFHLFISDGVAGVGVNDVLVQLTNITTIGSINLTGGDLTILT